MKEGSRSKHYDTSFNDAQGARRRAFVSWLGLALLGFNIVTAGLFAISAANADKPPLSFDLSQDRLVICTAGGMLVLDKDGQPIEGQSGLDHNISCVFCLPLMQGKVCAPAAQLAAVIELPQAVSPDVPQTYADILPTRLFKLSGSSSPRAPPAV